MLTELIASFLLASVVPPPQTAEPPLPVLLANRECFSFEASFQAAQGDAAFDEHEGWRVQGACYGTQWYLQVSSATNPIEHALCDGSRIWSRSGKSLILNPITQMAIPMGAWYLSGMLQLGERLEAPWSDETCRWQAWMLELEPSIEQPTPEHKNVSYEWTKGGPAGKMLHTETYQFVLVNGQWFWKAHQQSEHWLAEDGSRSLQWRSISEMDWPVAVGGALCATRVRGQGWAPLPRDPSGSPTLARTVVGTLVHATPLDPAEFDREMSARTTLAAGASVLDRSRAGPLQFVVGTRSCTFDGIEYQFPLAFTSALSDLEFTQRLREATLDALVVRPRDKASGAGPVAASSDTPVIVLAQRLAASTSDRLLIEPSRTVDLGMVHFGETPAKTQATFRIRNTSDVKQTITSVKASCGCAQTKADREVIEPGETATITTTLSIERAKTYHSSIWVVFEAANQQKGQHGEKPHIEELQVVAVGVPEKAVRATAVKCDPSGDVMTIVLYSESGRPEGDVGVPQGAEGLIASDSGWMPIGGDASRAKHWIRDIVKQPNQQ